MSDAELITAADGDATLIAWMLSLSHSERLDVLQAAANALTEFRRDFQTG